jgi:cyclophilin family peptidyl-prolyl cis-trans isomerase
MRTLMLGLILTLLPLAGLLAEDSAASKRPQVDIVTSMGTIRCTLFADEAPETVATFIGLAEGTKQWTDPRTNTEQINKPCYDGLIFHRVIPGFMIQGGDPLGNGTGGPGFQFKDEINATSLGLDKEMAFDGQALHPQCGYMDQQFGVYVVQPKLAAKGIDAKTPEPLVRAAIEKIMPDLKAVSLKAFYEAIGYVYSDTLPASHLPVKGSLAMANSGPNTNGSQFFINLGDTPHLAGKHTVFGEVTSGQEVVAAIGAVATGEQNRPVKPVTIVSIRRVVEKSGSP